MEMFWIIFRSYSCCPSKSFVPNPGTKGFSQPETLAKTIRQLNYIVALGVLRKHETLQNEIINVENSFYWLNELAEILNPYLDVE